MEVQKNIAHLENITLEELNIKIQIWQEKLRNILFQMFRLAHEFFLMIQAIK